MRASTRPGHHTSGLGDGCTRVTQPQPLDPLPRGLRWLFRQWPSPAGSDLSFASCGAGPGHSEERGCPRPLQDLGAVGWLHGVAGDPQTPWGSPRRGQAFQMKGGLQT